MDKVSTSNNSAEFKGTFITLRPKTDKPFKWPDSQILLLSTQYVKIKGYTIDKSLPVPFSDGEAYYDSFRDELLAIW